MQFQSNYEHVGGYSQEEELLEVAEELLVEIAKLRDRQARDHRNPRMPMKRLRLVVVEVRPLLLLLFQLLERRALPRPPGETRLLVPHQQS